VRKPGTDATRVASHNPWVSLHWLTTGMTVGGCQLYPPAARLGRLTALRAWTHSNAWFSNEEGKKGMVKEGQLADLAVLSADYLSVPDEAVSELSSVLTILGGNVVHGAAEFRALSPPLPPPSPSWSPVNRYVAEKRAVPPARGTRAQLSECSFHGHSFRSSALGCDCWVG